MNELRYTLVSDGSSDKRLIPVLNWLLQSHTSLAISSTWADPSVFLSQPKSLAEKIVAAVEFYPCDLLFVHRDSEGEPRSKRVTEIQNACAVTPDIPTVPVIPVRMQEAWLLISEEAIRTAAGKPRGRTPIVLPSRAQLENHSNPKQTLYQALRTASGLTGRHLGRFKVAAAAYRVSEIIEDYSPLRGLSAFDALESDLRRVLAHHGFT
jgi:hypothetical protein